MENKNMKKKVLLIAPPHYFKLRLDYLSSNLGLGYIAAFLEKHGHEVRFIDALVEGMNTSEVVSTRLQKAKRIGLSYKDIIARIPRDTDFIGITAPFSGHDKIVRELTENIKNAYECIPIVVGGGLPSILRKTVFYESVDFLICGEGEIPMLSLVEGKPPEDIQGVIFRKDGIIMDNGQAEQIRDLDTIPFPARHLMNMDKYLYFSNRGRTKKRTTSIITSRGCPFDCTFCSVHSICGYRYRKRTPENLISEIKQLVDEYGVEHLLFDDDNMTLDSHRMIKFLDMLIDNNFGCTWEASSGVKVDTLNQLMLEKMKKSKVKKLCIAVESGDEKILKLMNKKVNLEKAVKTIEICHQLGISTEVFFITGFPGETDESFKCTLKYAQRLKRAGVGGFNFFPLRMDPNTRLYRECKEKGYLLHEYSEDILLPGEFRYIQTEDLTPTIIERRAQRAMAKLNLPVLIYYIKMILYKIIPSKVRNYLSTYLMNAD